MLILNKASAPRYQRDRITSFLLVSKRTCGSDDLSVTLVEMQPGGFQRIHSHSQEQMYYIIEGSGEMIVDDERQLVMIGDCIFIPANARHGFRNRGDKDLRYLSAASPSFGVQESIELWPIERDEDSR